MAETIVRYMELSANDKARQEVINIINSQNEKMPDFTTSKINSNIEKNFWQQTIP